MFKSIKLQFIIIGILGSLLLCSMLGYLASQHAYFKNFHRFHDANSPFRYFPTASELLNTAIRNLNPHKTIILIGGNSIFRGTGQNANELWSDVLQKKLGNDFQVLNFANNTAAVGSASGVAFRMLIERYPKIIYVATYGLDADALDGNSFFKYIFWDAYYKSLFHPDPIEQKVIFETRQKEFKSWRGRRMQILAYLDSWLYFKNFWNWIDYHWITTGVDTIHGLHLKGKQYYDDLHEDFVKRKHQNETKKELIDATEKQLKIISQTMPSILNQSQTHLIPNFADTTRKSYERLFSPRYRSQVLGVWIPFNTAYIQKLPNAMNHKYDVISADLAAIVTTLGYHAVTVKNLTGNDFLDLVHLLASGGNTVAEEITPAIMQIAKTKNYLNRKEIKTPHK